MIKRSVLITIIVSVCLILSVGTVFSRVRVSSSGAKTKWAPTKSFNLKDKAGAASTGAAAGAVAGAVAGTAVRTSTAAQAATSAPSADVKGAAPPVATVAALKPAADSLIFNYDPKGKPDPFKPFLEAELALKKLKEMQLKQKQRKLPLSPLQRAGIEQFRLVGIGGDARRRTALVQDGGGKYYTLSVGVPIGLNGGKVERILGDRVVIAEPMAVGKKGKKGVKKIEMKLLKGVEEGKP